MPGEPNEQELITVAHNMSDDEFNEFKEMWNRKDGPVSAILLSSNDKTVIHTFSDTEPVLSQSTLNLVMAEAISAHIKHKDHGGSVLDPELSTERRLAALGEEFGEVCKELTYDNSNDPIALTRELVQLANVALTWVEYIHRTG